MEKINLIEERSFGDKFNELTGFIYDNFKVLAKWAFLYLLPFTIGMAAVIQYMPDIPVIRWTKLMLCVMIFTVVALAFMTVLKHHFLEGIPLKQLPLKKYIAEILKNVGVGMFSVFVFEVAISFVAYKMLDIIDFDDEFYAFIFFLFLYFIVVASISIPIFHTLNAVVLENKSGFGAMERAFKMLIYKPYMSLLFLGTMTVIGYLLPFIATIPYYIVRSVDDLFSPTINNAHITPKEVTELFFLTFLMFCYSLQMLAMTVGMMFDYGNAVEKVDNVSFMKKYNNFENL